MTPEEFINYIRRTPKQFVAQLPAKLEDWWKDKALKIALDKLQESPVFVIAEEDLPLRKEVATRIMVRHAPHSAMNMEQLADYCVEGADELIKRLKR